MLQRCAVWRYAVTTHAADKVHLYLAVAACIAVDLSQVPHCNLCVHLSIQESCTTSAHSIARPRNPLFLVSFIARHIKGPHMVALIGSSVLLILHASLAIGVVVAGHVGVAAGFALSAVAVCSILVCVILREGLACAACLANPQAIRVMLHLMMLALHGYQRITMNSPAVPMELAIALSCVLAFTIGHRTGTVVHIDS